MPERLKNFKLTLEYDGAPFAGFQIQPNGRTVQGELERAIEVVTGAVSRLHPAGRTDAGVHATGQVVSFQSATRLDPATLQRALNAELPAEIAVVQAEEVSDGFHARYSARRRRYRYQLWASPVRSPLRRDRWWHVRHPLDLDAMRDAAGRLVGQQDFAAFSAADPDLKSTTRRLERLDVTLLAELPVGREIEIDAWANAFLPHMVRNLVGLLAAVGGGKLMPADAERILAGRDRRLAPATAPAHGLTLVGVDYDE